MVSFIGKFFLHRFINILPKLSDKNLIKLVKFAGRFAPDTHKKMIAGVEKSIKDQTPVVLFIKRLLMDANSKCKKKILDNLILKGFLENQEIRNEHNLSDRPDNFVPIVVLISPTMRCNLRCKGCYAGKYGKEDDLPYEVFDRVVSEGEQLGTAFFIILGGEPFLYKDLIKIAKKHKHAYFQVYTNSTMLNEQMVKKLAKVGNILPILSLEGYEDLTDDRRGKGIYKKVMETMDRLKRHGVPFGYSCTVTKMNAELIMSDPFVDFLIAKGGYIGWYFLAMPVGANPDMSLMPTPEQRLAMVERAEHLRATRPFFFIDFWNDAPYVGGCIAGKHYCHITSQGDVEPCIFTHFAMDNIKEKSLLECFNSKYFQKLRSLQPYCENHFLPCMWIDHPHISRSVHKDLPVHPTHKGADEVIQNPELMAEIDEYAEHVGSIYDEAWEKWKSTKELSPTLRKLNHLDENGKKITQANSSEEESSEKSEVPKVEKDVSVSAN
ncbi:MAG: radical SAM protein [Candidatus Lokiarchaeota archaeon]|nr:radical SAM protein [Candidatus Lokiarchaeota archaeon]